MKKFEKFLKEDEYNQYQEILVEDKDNIEELRKALDGMKNRAMIRTFLKFIEDYEQKDPVDLKPALPLEYKDTHVVFHCGSDEKDHFLDEVLSCRYTWEIYRVSELLKGNGVRDKNISVLYKTYDGDLESLDEKVRAVVNITKYNASLFNAKQATEKGLVDTLAELKSTEDDVVLINVTGHGFEYDENMSGFDAGDGGLVTPKEFFKYTEGIKYKYLVLFFNQCLSGEFIEYAKKNKIPDNAILISSTDSEKGSYCNRLYNFVVEVYKHLFDGKTFRMAFDLSKKKQDNIFEKAFELKMLGPEHIGTPQIYASDPELLEKKLKN